jgi:hypothetical protein
MYVYRVLASTVLVGSDAVDLSILQDLQELLSQQIHNKASLFFTPYQSYLA